MRRTHYVSCPSCRTRMKLTGQKKVIYDTGSGKIYDREYQCPSCGRILNYNESRNFIH
jgi:predicted  nucleic acid-binding Zn-ribbon protein